jgi:hypothetical protein
VFWAQVAQKYAEKQVRNLPSPLPLSAAPPLASDTEDDDSVLNFGEDLRPLEPLPGSVPLSKLWQQKYTAQQDFYRAQLLEEEAGTEFCVAAVGRSGAGAARAPPMKAALRLSCNLSVGGGVTAMATRTMGGTETLEPTETLSRQAGRQAGRQAEQQSQCTTCPSQSPTCACSAAYSWGIVTACRQREHNQSHAGHFRCSLCERGGWQ